MFTKKLLTILTLILTVTAGSTVFAAAKNPPTVDSPTVTNIGATTATLGGTVTSDGGQALSERGVVWHTSSPAESGGTVVIEGGTSVSTFTVPVTGLPQGTLIYFKAYATNPRATSYSAESSFTTTSSAGPPVLDTSTLASLAAVTSSSATLGGFISSDGNDPSGITQRGTVWGLAPSPAGNALAEGGAATGSFSHLRSGLNSGALIYFRSYATNDSGTSYGPDNSFHSEPAGSPASATIDNVGDTSFRINWPSNPGGSGDGALVVVSTNPITATPADGTEHSFNSTFATGGTDIGSSEYVVYRGTGANSVTVDGLTPSTGYNVAVFYSAGSGSGQTGINYREEAPASNSQTTNTPAVPPTVTSPTVSTITTTTAVLGGNVTDNGGAPVSDRGIVWNTSSPPESGGTIVSEGLGSGLFTQLVNSLPPGTLVYFKAYASNSAGTSYSSESSFTTLVALPTVTVIAASSITSTSAVMGGIVTNDGGGTVSDRGTVWGTSPAPTGNALTEGSGTGSFSHLRSGLPAGVTVYFRAYATNEAGTAYSADSSFIPSEPPVLSAPTAINITYFSAVLGGTIDSDGGNPILSRGTVWNTTGTPVVENAQVEGGTATGLFSHTRFLPLGTTVYYRAFASNVVGTGYSPESSFITAFEPTVQASNISFPKVAARSMRIKWTPGNGEGSIVVLRTGSRVDPADATDYTANPDFSLGEDIGSGNIVVYKGSGNMVLVNGLTELTTYTVAIYEYAGSGNNTYYLGPPEQSPAEATRTTSDVRVHNMDYNVDCDGCHNHGSFLPRETELEDSCKSCHNPSGVASGKLQFALHLTPSNPAVDYVDCGTCHELHSPGGSNTTMGYNPITSETKQNKAFFRANVEKYVPTARPGAGFLHNDVYNSSDYLNAVTPERAVEGGDDTTARGTCQVCHSMTNYHRSSNTSGADQCHNGEGGNCGEAGETHCARCHQHNNRFIGVGGSQTCMQCHDGVQGSRPDIVSGEFTRLSHHVSGTLDETDCEVCHDQGGHTGGFVKLWNTDNHNESFGQSAPDPQYISTLSAGQGEKFEGHCLSCHDGDGAQAEAAPQSPFNGSGAPPVIDVTAWNASAHKRDFATYPSSSVSCIGDGVSGCHGSGHGSEKPFLLAPAETGPLASEDYCFVCHDSDGPSQHNTQIDFPATPGWRVTSVSGALVNQRHDISTADQTYSGGVVSCADCHDVHADNATNPVVDPDDGSALPVYSISNSYTDDGYNFSYDSGGNLDPTFPEGCADAGCTPGYTEPDYIQYCLSCHDGTAPPGVTVPALMVNMADAWLDDQHGQAEGSSGTRTGKGGLKAPYVNASDDAADNDASQPYAAMNCTDCHGAHGSSNIFNLKSEITIAGVQLTVGGTTTLNEAHYAGNTSYDLPLIGGVQTDHYWGAWCTFCHKVDTHPGKVEADACTGGHMHGGGSH